MTRKITAIGFDYFGVVYQNSIDLHIVDLMKQLRHGGYKVGVLSNAGVGLRREIESSVLGGLVDVVCLSGEHGLLKPDVAFFNIFLERLGVNASEFVFVDDSVRSLETSHIVGYTPILFSDYGSLVSELRVLGVEG
ncbi:MAG: HAD hydrolase-like protein [Candidatus Moranbacteria bacterium]|nr:HAD hydrolase-like protein [Candidatus Moranbacteria bacterium]